MTVLLRNVSSKNSLQHLPRTKFIFAIKQLMNNNAQKHSFKHVIFEYFWRWYVRLLWNHVPRH